MKSPIVSNKGGETEFPEEPNLGIQIDWNRVEKFNRKFFSMTEINLRKKVMKEKYVFTVLEFKRGKDKEAKQRLKWSMILFKQSSSFINIPE